MPPSPDITGVLTSHVDPRSLAPSRALPGAFPRDDTIDRRARTTSSSSEPSTGTGRVSDTPR